jgi:fermentation-respiration switch protein FrsA (DUF1100 family)
VLYTASDGMIFIPPPDPTYKDTPDIIKLKTSDGTLISAFHLPNPATGYTVLYSHGSAEDIGDIKPILNKFYMMGLSSFGYDYHGYGTSQGEPSEAAAYQDIDAAYDYVTGELKVPPESIILYGYSMGSGPAVDLAARRPVGGLVLEGAFVSGMRAITGYRLLPFDVFNNIGKIGKVKVPVMVIHGIEDNVVSFSHGERLYLRANEPRTNLWVEGAGHFDLLPKAGLKYSKKLKSFIQGTTQSLEAGNTP